MKAPDKIYLYREQPKDYFDEDWHDLPASDMENIEYIRKDSLLEWAKGEMMPGNSAEGKGWNLALQTLIDKINSL